jgi:hypothetical protein
MQPVFFQGLKKRPTFDQIVGYLETEQQILKYPDRTATRIKDDPYYTNLDGQGGLSLTEQSKNLQKEQMRQLELKKIYQDMGISENLGRAMGVNRADGNESVGSGSNYESVSAHTVADSNIEDDYDALDTFGKEQETLKEDKTKNISEKVAEAVQQTVTEKLIEKEKSSRGAAASSSGAAGAAASSSGAAAPAAPLDDADLTIENFKPGNSILRKWSTDPRILKNYNKRADELIKNNDIDDLRKQYSNYSFQPSAKQKKSIIKEILEHEFNIRFIKRAQPTASHRGPGYIPRTKF